MPFGLNILLVLIRGSTPAIIFPVPHSGTTGRAALPKMQGGLLWAGSALPGAFISVSLSLGKMKTQYIGFMTDEEAEEEEGEREEGRRERGR